MSILIRDVQMPESCRRCKCHKIETEMWHDKYDMCCLKNIDIIDLDVRPKWCPLVEVDIDADEF